MGVAILSFGAVLLVSPILLSPGLAQSDAPPERSMKAAPKSVVPAGPRSGSAVDLTAEECTTLGGTIYETSFLCRSGRYCGTTDASGNRHRVCIEAAAPE